MADCEIGIDIQHLVKVNEPLMRRVLSDEELGMVMAQQGEERQMLFARLWALKEAYLKAVGTGITDDFPSFSLENERPRLVKTAKVSFFSASLISRKEKEPCVSLIRSFMNTRCG